MSHSRLTLAVDEHGLALPDEGRIAVFAPRAGFDLSALPKERVQIIQPLFPDFQHWQRSGFKCETTAAGDYALALVCLPRAKAQARDLIARAAASARVVVVDGQKTDGIDSVLKDCRKKGDVQGVVSKAHGKLCWFDSGDFADWLAPDHQKIADGFTTRAGVFSADGIDPASKLLAETLPESLGKTVADLGAGWGYLASRILMRDTVTELHLVEADHVALDCAKLNFKDDRAAFHWADATDWTPPKKLDCVVMNPPFHSARAAEPSLGIAFIQNAARVLAPSGVLWLVANRHLPYETALQAAFGQVEEIAGDNRFKVIRATRPARAKR